MFLLFHPAEIKKLLFHKELNFIITSCTESLIFASSHVNLQITVKYQKTGIAGRPGREYNRLIPSLPMI
jgi:hypothetical protein